MPHQQMTGGRELGRERLVIIHVQHARGSAQDRARARKPALHRPRRLPGQLLTAADAVMQLHLPRGRQVGTWAPGQVTQGVDRSVQQQLAQSRLADDLAQAERAQ